MIGGGVEKFEHDVVVMYRIPVESWLCTVINDLKDYLQRDEAGRKKVDPIRTGNMYMLSMLSIISNLNY